MLNNSKKKNPISLCAECGGKLKLKKLNIAKFDKDRYEIYLYTYKCPKCKKEFLINVHQLNMVICEEPDA